MGDSYQPGQPRGNMTPMTDWAHREVVDMGRYILEADPETSDHGLGRQLREWAEERMPDLAPGSWEGMRDVEPEVVGSVVRERIHQNRPHPARRLGGGGIPR